jgi:glycosyltransferase involved in cell wall biosynthesis
MTRVAICQPLIPHYRVPVFNRLAREYDIELTVFSGLHEGSLRTAEGRDSFEFVFVPDQVKTPGLGRFRFKYQDSNLTVVDRRYFDLVILCWDAHYLSLWLALIRARIRKGPPVILWGHGVSKRDNWVRRSLRNFLGRQADAVLLYTRAVAERLVEKHGFCKERVFVAQNALDQAPIQKAREQWEANPERLAEFRYRYKLDPRYTLVFVSRLEPDNGLDRLMKGFHILREKRPEAKLAIIGDGSDRQRLECLAREYGMAESVIFAGALYQEEDIAPWMLSAAAFCYPKNIGLSLLHAFGYGLPVVTSDHLQGHSPEIEALVPGINGLFYRDGDAEHMAEQCLYLMEHPMERETLAENARRTVLEDYTLSNMLRGFGEVIERF